MKMWIMVIITIIMIIIIVLLMLCCLFVLNNNILHANSFNFISKYSKMKLYS